MSQTITVTLYDFTIAIPSTYIDSQGQVSCTSASTEIYIEGIFDQSSSDLILTTNNFTPLTFGTTYTFDITSTAQSAGSASDINTTFDISVIIQSGSDILLNYTTTGVSGYFSVASDNTSYYFNTNYSFSGTLSCLHGNSLTITPNGHQKIKLLSDKDFILTPEDTFVKIKRINQCWLRVSITDSSYCEAVIFEPNSLGFNEPSEKLIIDKGHLMCLKSDYLKNGLMALKYAGEYLNNNTIYLVKWNDEQVNEANDDIVMRYDLSLENSYPVYMSNNIVIKAKDN